MTPRRPWRPEALLARLAAMGIPAKTRKHQPVFTVAEAKALRADLPGAHIKNLFLRDKKGRMWLLVALADSPVDLKCLARTLGARGLSFASHHRLMTHLGVSPGAVTPFGVINDDGGLVEVVIERAVLDFSLVNCHPLDNAMTTSIGTQDLLRFLGAVGHRPRLIGLGAGGE